MKTDHACGKPCTLYWGPLEGWRANTNEGELCDVCDPKQPESDDGTPFCPDCGRPLRAGVTRWLCDDCDERRADDRGRDEYRASVGHGYPLPDEEAEDDE